MAAETAPAIAVVGSANVDLIVRVARVPRPGETVLGGDLARAGGGKGANQAVAARRLGAEVAFVGCVGADAFGEEAAAALAREGVRVEHLRRVADAPTGVALIAVGDDGQNSIVVAPGANARLGPADVAGAEAALRGARVVVAQLEVPLEAVRAAFALAHAAGGATLLNPAPARPLDDALLGLTDVLVCNEGEAATLTGLPTDDLERTRAAAAALLARGPRLVALTLGAAGCVLATAAAIWHQPAFAARVVDTTAAGDAFVGALAARLAIGEDPAAAARYATAAAALSVGRAGAQPSLPTAAEVAALLARPVP